LGAALALAALIAANQPLMAQEPGPPQAGRLVGRILDEATGAPIPGAQVGVAAGGVAVTSAIDGRYVLLNVSAGPVAIAVRAIGYAPKTVSGVVVPAGGAATLDVTLSPQTVQVAEITVSAEAERASVRAALEEQRNSDQVVNAVSAEQIARSPDSDAAQAVQRVSGVTVQDGRYVFVRGLGERYTTTSLNSARIPSPEPERKVVPLDLFPSSLLEAVSTTKTFTPDQPGDFSGANVNLRTREFPARRTWTLSLSTGLNSAATGRNLPEAPTVGREWLGYAGGARQLPDGVRDAGGLSGLSEAEVSGLIGQFRNSWSAGARSGSPNSSLGVSLGGEDPVLGLSIGYLASFTYGSGLEVRDGEQRATPRQGASPGTALPNYQYRGLSVSAGVLWGGLLNLTARLGATSKLSLQNTFTRSADNGVSRLAGFSEEFGTDWDITRLAFVERGVRSSQLNGQHLLGLRHLLEWTVTSAAVTRNEPDRSDLIYTASIDSVSGEVTPLEWFANGRAGTRTFSSLDERSLEVGASYRVEIGASRRSALKLGWSRRSVERDADARAYSIVNSPSNPLTSAELQAPPEQIFAQPDRLFMSADAQVGRYTATDRVSAAYAQAELGLGSSLRLVGGARVERWDLDLTTATTFGTDSTIGRRNTDVLPALALTWRAGENTNLRLSASQTLSRPEYRELAEVTTRDIAGGVDQQGNDSLERALIRNLDLRWEWYPRRGEVLSVAVFAKRFERPIERILRGATGASITSWVNTRGASNYGVEFELRHGLDLLSAPLAPLSLFVNLTLMRSEIEIDTALASLANARRAMVGQAPYVVNAGLGYANAAGSVNATLLYNVVGRRIWEAGTTGLPDAYEQPRHVLDLSLRLPFLLADTELKLDARNLLDAPYRVQQGDVTRLRYKVGRTVSAGLTWTP
jgi:hypothetical protein